MSYSDNCGICGESYDNDNLMACSGCGREVCYRCGSNHRGLCQRCGAARDDAVKPDAQARSDAGTSYTDPAAAPPGPA